MLTIPARVQETGDGAYSNTAEHNFDSADEDNTGKPKRGSGKTRRNAKQQIQNKQAQQRCGFASEWLREEIKFSLYVGGKGIILYGQNKNRRFTPGCDVPGIASGARRGFMRWRRS